MLSYYLEKQLPLLRESFTGRLGAVMDHSLCPAENGQRLHASLLALPPGGSSTPLQPGGDTTNPCSVQVSRVEAGDSRSSSNASFPRKCIPPDSVPMCWDR